MPSFYQQIKSFFSTSKGVENQGNLPNNDGGYWLFDNHNHYAMGTGMDNSDSFTSEILQAFKNCGSLYLQSDPRYYINLSKVTYKLLPHYQRGITYKAIFLGNIEITDLTNTQQMQYIVDLLMESVPIYDNNTILPIGFGINKWLNLSIFDACIYGMSYSQLITDSEGKAVAIQMLVPDKLRFDYDDKGARQLYYGSIKEPINPNSLFILYNESIRGYDWGAPLIYGGKFVVESLSKLLNAQVNGYIRNMNPFDLTLMGVDNIDAKDDKKNALIAAVKSLKQDLITAGKRSMEGKSSTMLVDLPHIKSVTNIKGNSTIPVIGAKDISTYEEMFSMKIGVPHQLMKPTAGAMNTDQTKVAALLMEAWASDLARPDYLPVIKRLVKAFFFSHDAPVSNRDISVELKRNETLLATLSNGNSNPLNEMSQQLFSEMGDDRSLR